ncbi:alpha/beta hydrolase [Vineibacter terrae]|uniref:Alpha/beta hydrolase n=1 Tax=Vineibacter terrae TaxID=2586908 RepID=A0A5C8P959_9HYPH|nr:alpha/beta hydrolase [Vineibacter terrae]TXL69866.1 alpha/beta hydrolase [Vineibacter terrae]
MGSIKTADGRNLAWSEWGDPQARPVIFCPGAGMAGSLPFGQGVAARLRLRVISVDRPGLGGSDPDLDKSFDSWSRDIRALLAHLDAPPAPAIGFSQGAPFALALGAAGVADCVSLVSGQDELSHPAIHGLLPEPVAVMVRRAATDPLGLEAEIAATATADWLWHMIESMSGEQDRSFYASDAFAPAYRAALAAGFRRGAAGYARDTVLAMAPWPFQIERLTCPVHIWYGLEDTSPVHSPDFGSALSRRIGAARLTRFENEGSAILWTRADDILNALATA